MRSLVEATSLAAIALLGAGALASGGAPLRSVAYSSSGVSASSDTIRPKASPGIATSIGVELGAVIPGYLSSWGLPPVPGHFSITDSGLVFRAATGGLASLASTISLAYVDTKNGRAHYLFRVSAGVFETEAPGPLLDQPVDPLPGSSKALGTTVSGGLMDARDELSALQAARRIGASRYADSLYSLLGHPRAPLGLIGSRGRVAGRLGEYIAARDSLALDPGRMTGEAQLRHALAHELGHRWQGRARAQLAMLWSGVPAIRDPRRYGYGDRSEHQAEAIAFAVNFLQTTAANPATSTSSLTLLNHYELLVPGTRTLVRYFSLQPIYRRHPLRALLTTDRITYALEK